MTICDDVKSVLEKYHNDWPTLDDLLEKFPTSNYSNLQKVILKIYEGTKNERLKKCAFRARYLRREDIVILFGIRLGIKGGGNLARHAKRRGIPLHKNPKTIVQKLKKLSEQDEEIKKILEKAGFLK